MLFMRIVAPIVNDLLGGLDFSEPLVFDRLPSVIFKTSLIFQLLLLIFSRGFADSYAELIYSSSHCFVLQTAFQLFLVLGG